MWPRRRSYNPDLGKQSREAMIKKIIRENGGRMEKEELHKILKSKGYPHLIHSFKAMGFRIDIEEYVYD